MAEPEVVDVPRRVGVGCSSYVFPWNLGKFMSEAYPVIQDALKEKGIQDAGLAYARYLMFSPVLVHVEAGIFLDNKEEVEIVPLPSPLRLLEIPACKAASAWHTGPYTGLPAAWRLLMAWMRKQGLYCSNICFEEYHTDPESEPDEAKHRTRLFCAFSDSWLKSWGW